MVKKGGVAELEIEISNKSKLVAMLAPCFVAQFDYPQILQQLKDLGFDKVVELTFGAKIVNHAYHKILKKFKGKGLLISTVCPGIVQIVLKQFPQYKKNLIPIYSPMVVMGKICRRDYPEHKVVFISPCSFKKMEAETTNDIDIVISMNELEEILNKYNIKPKKGACGKFDLFYNDYTKIYPLAGGLSKTARIKKILKEEESKSMDGIAGVIEFLKNPDKKVRFLDANFCIGGCIGGPLLTPKRTLEEKKQRVLDYVKLAMKEKIPQGLTGVLKEAKGIKLKASF